MSRTRVPTCVIVLGLFNWLLVHYAFGQRPLSAANQTTLLPDVLLPKQGLGNGLLVVGSSGLSNRRLSPGGNKTMSGSTRSNSFNPNNAAGSSLGGGGGGLGNGKTPATAPGKLSDEELSNKIKNRILKQSRLKPNRGGGGSTSELEEELPIGLPPPDHHHLPTFPVSPSPAIPPRGGDTFSRPAPTNERKSAKNKFAELQNSQFPEGNLNRDPANSQRHRNKSNKFQELRNMTRLNKAQLGPPPPPRFQYEQHINILPVKSNQAKPPLHPEVIHMGGDVDEGEEDHREETHRFSGMLGNDSFQEHHEMVTEQDADVFHPKYQDHDDVEHEVDEGDVPSQWPVLKNNSRDPLKKVKWRFNMDNVSG